jgi:acetylglutamate kinase
MQDLHIIKIGGKILEDKPVLEELLKRFTALSGAKILVHGGGKKSDEICIKLGIEPKMVEGRRVTDEPTLEVVTMVYAGFLNKTVVSMLQAFGCNALGLSGADGKVILAKKREKGTVDYGFAGDVVGINQQLLNTLLKEGITPVLCSITHDGKAQLLNTNADTIATEVAKAMAPFFNVRLLYCFEKQGVLQNPADSKSVIRKLDLEEYKSLRHQNLIMAGMIPKLENAFDACRTGVKQIIIGNPAGFDCSGNHKGTEICL